jgi:hypothetical protein
MKAVQFVTPAKIGQVAMSPGHGCEPAGAGRTCSTGTGTPAVPFLHEVPAFAGMTGGAR